MNGDGVPLRKVFSFLEGDCHLYREQERLLWVRKVQDIIAYEVSVLHTSAASLLQVLVPIGVLVSPPGCPTGAGDGLTPKNKNTRMEEGIFHIQFGTPAATHPSGADFVRAKVLQQQQLVVVLSSEQQR